MPVVARDDVMAGRQKIGAEIARGGEQVGEFHVLVAGDTGDRRLARDIGAGERLDHLLAKALLVVEHVMGNSEPGGDVAGVVDVLAGAAGALAVGRLAVVVELHGHADDVIALAASIAATTEESTPPDIATTTRVSAGDFSSPRLLATLLARCAKDVASIPLSFRHLLPDPT